MTADRSVERAFLNAFGDWESDYLMDDQYIYTITLKPFLTNKETYSLLEIAHFEVMKGKVIFDGASAEFEKRLLRLWKLKQFVLTSFLFETMMKCRNVEVYRFTFKS